MAKTAQPLHQVVEVEMTERGNPTRSFQQDLPFVVVVVAVVAAAVVASRYISKMRLILPLRLLAVR